MFEVSHLLVFVAAVLVLVIVPGPNTMVILSQSLAGKKSLALATVAGVEVGTLVHTFVAAASVGMLLATAPMALTGLQLCGAAYLLIIGIRSLRQNAFDDAAMRDDGSARTAFRRGLIANLLNPKVGVFFLAFIPQFIDPSRGSVFVQFVLLGAIVSLVGWCIGAVMALGAASVATSLRRHAGFARWQPRITGLVLVTVAVWVGHSALT